MLVLSLRSAGSSIILVAFLYKHKWTTVLTLFVGTPHHHRHHHLRVRHRHICSRGMLGLHASALARAAIQMTFIHTDVYDLSGNKIQSFNFLTNLRAFVLFN